MRNDPSALAAVLRSAGPSDRALATDPAFYELLTGSYARLVGTPLAPERPDGPRWLYEDASFCILAHNTDPDPRFVYANTTAQACFEYSWDELTSLPSRLSAEAPNREERQRLLDSVTRQGFASDYRGLRIAKSGRLFWIEDATVWQLLGPDGTLYGQGAVLRGWSDA
ncbi:MEKHLA domain-containing protein [Chelatococcus sp. GCM10030263]|uniref:MEKHLA domain-containing protein n=1 Tax=Chelatococcus sp. GCM10030263 TaxID=3273387 RepID=UPI0036134CA4